MDRGDLVSDEIVNGIVSERLDAARLQPTASSSTASRAPSRRPKRSTQMLAEKGMELDAVVEITADADVLVRRVVKRAKESGGARGRRQ